MVKRNKWSKDRIKGNSILKKGKFFIYALTLKDDACLELWLFQKLVAVKITKLNAISKTFKVKILPIKATLVYLVHPLWLGPPQFDFSFGIVAPEFRTTFPLNSNSSNIPSTKIHCIYDSLLFFLYILSTRIHCNCSPQ